ncbi:MAG: hypothetical protein ACRC7H_07555, partial [Plesiomonas shigelloides]
ISLWFLSANISVAKVTLKNMLSKNLKHKLKTLRIFLLTSCQPSTVSYPSASHPVRALCNRRYWLLAEGILVIVYKLFCVHAFTLFTNDHENTPGN